MRRWRKFAAWREVPEGRWADWRWQVENSVCDADALAELLPLSEDERKAIAEVSKVYPMRITPHYLSLVEDLHDPSDPVRLQAVPRPEELDPVGEEDPLDETMDSPVPGLTHRYPDRVLLVTTNFCPTYCRHCTRKRIWCRWEEPDLGEWFRYIRAHPEVRDVLVSGGSPLCLPLAKLEEILKGICEIPHVEVVRLGAREPATLPQRFSDPELLNVLERYSRKLWMVVHFNHPREVTPEAGEAVWKVLRLGIPVLSQTVLLRNVNDSPGIMRELMRRLLAVKVKPYYILHGDPVKGTMHFRTSLGRGNEVMEGLRGHISGLGVPHYMVDLPYGAGKVPVGPNYLLTSGEKMAVFRNYEGLLVAYPLDGKGDEDEGQGVSKLLSSGGALVPDGVPRLGRRR